jgi:hypothetical protein
MSWMSSFVIALFGGIIQPLTALILFFSNLPVRDSLTTLIIDVPRVESRMTCSVTTRHKPQLRTNFCFLAPTKPLNNKVYKALFEEVWLAQC